MINCELRATPAGLPSCSASPDLASCPQKAPPAGSPNALAIFPRASRLLPRHIQGNAVALAIEQLPPPEISLQHFTSPRRVLPLWATPSFVLDPVVFVSDGIRIVPGIALHQIRMSTELAVGQIYFPLCHGARRSVLPWHRPPLSASGPRHAPSLAAATSSGRSRTTAPGATTRMRARKRPK